MGSGNRGPTFNPGSVGQPIHTPPPRSPIAPRPHQPRILPQKPLIVPLTCVEEELHPHTKQRNTYHGHANDNVHISSDLCFIGCVFYFTEHLSKQSPKEDFKTRLVKWKANIVIYGGLVEDTYNKVTCTHVVAGKFATPLLTFNTDLDIFRR